MSYEILHGDCLDVMALCLADDSVDAIVTDPPYGLGFMGQHWDHGVPGVEFWAEMLRILKPGGHLLAFAGTRTQHRMASNIEDAGFEIRDLIAWVYGEGMPKSFNLDRVRGEKTCNCEGRALPCTHGNEATTNREAQADGNNLPSLRRQSDEAKCMAEKGEDPNMQPPVQREAASESACCERIPAEGAAWSESETTGRKQPRLERRRDGLQEEGELQEHSLPAGAGMGAADGAGGRLPHGAPPSDGANMRVSSDTDGGRAPSGPRPPQQRPGEPRIVAGQSQPQVSGAWPICGGCGKPRIPSGWGTALKPALEPITVARKPLIGTVADNVQRHGTGAINIDGCRVASTDSQLAEKYASVQNAGRRENSIYGADSRDRAGSAPHDAGRWPANLIHDGSEEVVALFPDSNGSGGSLPNVKITGYGDGIGNGNSEYFGGERTPHASGKGSAARFFYCAKASRKDRNEGCEEMVPTTTSDGRAVAADNAYQRGKTERNNHHPTVKPTDLMRYLCRLVTPPGGIVLDPFMGSGSTGKAAVLEGFRFIGIEREDAYIAIAEARLKKAAA